MRHVHFRPLAVFTAIIVVASLSVGRQQSEAVATIPDGAVAVPDSQQSSLGESEAPVVMVVFTDYQCAYCKKFFEERLPEINDRFVESGQLRVVIRDLPLKRHKFARPAAAAAACAELQDSYWPMHESLYARQSVIPEMEFSDLAAELDLDVDAFDACMSDPKVQDGIDADIAAAKGARVAGTPAFLIGVPVDGQVMGSVFTGFQPLSVYEAEIREYLESTDRS